MTAATTSSSSTLLTGGSVIDGGGSPPVRADVLLEVDRIVAVGPTAGEQAGPDAVVHDVTGLTVLPGLIDAHCHITFGEPASNATGRRSF